LSTIAPPALFAVVSLHKERNMTFRQENSRRTILRWSAGAAGILLCGSMLPNFGISPALAADLGEGDVAILNYAYALEQLEAAFYTKVTDYPFKGATQQETETFTEIRDHERAHVDFFRKALGDHAIPAIEVDFSKIDFDHRSSVLGAADAFENLGVAAFNGAGPLLVNADYLAAAGTIVSVEARHAAMISALLHGPSSASAGKGHVSSKGLDSTMPPSKVLVQAKSFIRTPLTAASLK
jgi:Ferritin-like domain